MGDLYVAFEQLKAKLLEEGLFDPNHKKPLPPYPGTIAIITSSAGAAVHDMIRILRRRYPIAKVVLLPVRVQGTEAPPEIAGAIRYANRWHVADLIITGRGGGSIEDLWAFNDERVARAVYESELPVISAVGHEPDVTISDFVADARASTPSNAAEIAVPDQAELLRWLRGAENRISQAEAARLRTLRRQLTVLTEKRVLRDQMAYVQDKRMELTHVQQRLGIFRPGQWVKKAGICGVGGCAGRHESFESAGARLCHRPDGKRNHSQSDQDAPVGSHVEVTLAEGTLQCTVEGGTHK